MNNGIPWWSSETFWKKTAIWVTGVMFVALVVLTLDTMPQITAGSERVPAYSVINKHVGYEFNDERNIQVPVIGAEDPLFGQIFSEEEAEALVSHGKKITQGRNCMGCHTLLGNGSYFAPDLTKSWLDPGWSSEPEREQLMIEFLMDPVANARSFGSGRMMPDLNITEEEAKAVIAFLKWMSSIDTNGFPYNFTVIDKES